MSKGCFFAKPWVRCGLLFCAFAAGAYAQSLDLRGRVVQGDGSPVAEAWVELGRAGASAKTAVDGTFAFKGSTSMMPGTARPFAYRLERGFLIVDARAPLDLRMEIVDGAGRLQGGYARRVEPGHSRFAVADAMPSPARAPDVLFLRLCIGGSGFTHPFIPSGNGSSEAVFAPAYPETAAKRSAIVDTLRIRKTGYRDFAKPIENYAAGSLGDLVLAAGEGSVCARQHPERTSEGFDILYCDALFDQAPRVHLPATAPDSAYAMMTRDAFVTVAGKTYPSSSVRVTSDPEIKRHASALYAIKLANDKPSGFRPAIVFAESLFLSHLKGKAFDGFISKRVNGRYELDPTLPVQVRVLGERFQGGTNPASAFELKATVANLASAVTASDGSCMPSLASYGSQSPFDAGADVVLPVGRVPSMHAFGDDELVFEIYAGGAWMGSIMSGQWFLTPLDLAKDAAALTGAYTGVGHGTPGGIPMLNLKPMSGGGSACTPK